MKNRLRDMQYAARKADIDHMAKSKPSEKASAHFRHKVGEMIRAQGTQMESKTAAEYIAEKYDITRNIPGGDRYGQKCAD